MYTRMLVPVDGSNTALRGLIEALRLAKGLKAQVRLIHVVNELINDPTVTPSVYYEHSLEHMRESGRKALRHARELGRRHYTEVHPAAVSSTVCRYSGMSVDHPNSRSIR